MKSRESHLISIETYFEEFFRKSPFTVNSEMSKYHFKTGGKRLRALLPMQIFEIMDKNPTDAIPLGASVEMIHNATLVHDDLQDGDEVRRGLTTVWKKYSAAQAINCGDAMFQYAFQILGQMKIDPAKQVELFNKASHATLEVIEGQAQEFKMKDEAYPEIERYLGVIRGKTSALFAYSIESALYCLGLDSKYCEEAKRASFDLGMLFQIQDDVLDIYGEKGRDRRATDVAEGKVSFFVAHVNEVGSDADKKSLREILLKPRLNTSDDDILKAIQIFEKYKSKEAAIEYIRKIQKNVLNNTVLSAEPKIHSFLNGLGEMFLEPLNGIL